MSADLLLTESELFNLTGYERFADQRKWLSARGWRYEITANGRPSVSRAYAEKQLGLEPVHILAESKRRDWKPNISAIKKAA